jgi:hypothetical protein
MIYITTIDVTAILVEPASPAIMREASNGNGALIRTEKLHNTLREINFVRRSLEGGNEKGLCPEPKRGFVIIKNI